MPSGPVIEGFAEKLRLAMGRANLSRAQLAQAVAVDKTVVGRWLNGVLTPSDHSLTSLTIVLANHLPQFDRVAWEAPVAEFARRLGIQAAAPALPPDASPVLPRMLQSTAASLQFAAERYAGLWVLVFPAPALDGRIVLLPIRISWVSGAMALSIEYRYRPVVDLKGATFYQAGWLTCVMESAGQGMADQVAMLAFQALAGEAPLVLDGLLATRRNTAISTLFAVRVLAFKLDQPADDAGFAAMERRAELHTEGGAGARLPEAMRAALRAPADQAAGPYWIVLDPAQSWTTGEMRGNDPARAPQMEALAAVRALFADLVPPSKA